MLKSEFLNASLEYRILEDVNSSCWSFTLSSNSKSEMTKHKKIKKRYLELLKEFLLLFSARTNKTHQNVFFPLYSHKGQRGERVWFNEISLLKPSCMKNIKGLVKSSLSRGIMWDEKINWLCHVGSATVVLSYTVELAYDKHIVQTAYVVDII